MQSIVSTPQVVIYDDVKKETKINKKELFNLI
jgi:hypothetical protein